MEEINHRQKKGRRDIILLILLMLALFLINYSFFDKTLEGFITEYETERVHIDRVIDGDTIKSGNESIRLLGINTPERGEFFYNEAKEFLDEKILNKTVSLEFGKDRYDRYKRVLAYVYLDGKNVNLELVKNGFANYYFPSGRDIHYNEFREAWESCVEKNINICESSKEVCAQCLELRELSFRTDSTTLHNKCDFSCDLSNWQIKDEGRKTFVFPEFILNANKDITIKTGNGTDTNSLLYWRDETYVWTRTGDTLFLRDEKGRLVLFESY